MLKPGPKAQPRTSRLFYCCIAVFTVIVVGQVIVIHRLLQRSPAEPHHQAKNSKLHMIQPKTKAPKNTSLVEATRPDRYLCGEGGDVAYYRATEQGFWVCVHEKSDVVSNRIRASGVWDDCEDEVWLLWTLFGSGKEGSDQGFESRAWLKKDRGPNAREQSSKETGRSLTIVDVGANIGACSVRLAQLGHTLVSFEPLQENFLRLQGSVAINNLSSSLIAVNSGAAEAAGSREALSEQGNMGNTLLVKGKAAAADADTNSIASAPNSSFSRRTVSVSRLDESLALLDPPLQHVDLLKLDCQGCELAALRGASSLIDAGKVRLVVFEFSPPHLAAAGHDPEEVLEWLHIKGFRISTLLMGKAVGPADFLSFAQQHRTRAVDLIARRDPWSARADAGAGRKEGGEYVFGVLPVKEERDATDRFLFLLMCAVPIIFGCSGLAWTLYTL